MWPKLSKWNTLRNQILIGFLFVMMIVLLLVGIIMFNSVSTLLKNKAEKQIKQTAIQANGRLEALINQIDMLTTQAVNDPYLQQILLAETNGKPASFDQRQSLSRIATNIQPYTVGVESVEIYTGEYMRLYPLDENKLDSRVQMNWIKQADQEKGKLVWIGVDPKNPQSVLAIRRISLIDRWFSNGGYLLVRINRSYFQFREFNSDASSKEAMLLVDRDSRPIVVKDLVPVNIDEFMRTEEQTVTVRDQHYIMVKQPSDVTGWTLMILNPVSDITEGISVLRTAIIASGAIGSLLFLLMSLLLSTMITRPILRLIKAMRNTRQGVLTPNPVSSITAEINDLNYTYNQMVDNINHLIELVYEKEILQSRTELKALQAQINPHFLFNTLEALYWSLQEKEEEELADLVVAMSELFRYIIANPNKDEWVTVGEELEHIERYLLIMKMRFGDRLIWSIEFSEDFSWVKIPKLLIQPLVENAILHGLEGRTGTGSVHVSVSQSSQASTNLLFTVTDDGPGMDPPTLQKIMDTIGEGKIPSGKGKGMGIGNVQRRLKLYFSDPGISNEGLSIKSRAGVGTIISFEIPMEWGIHNESPAKNDHDRG